MYIFTSKENSDNQKANSNNQKLWEASFVIKLG